MTKPQLDGRKVAFIHSHLDSLLADAVEKLADAVVLHFAGSKDEAMAIVVEAMKDGSKASRITSLLVAGEYQSAEDIVLHDQFKRDSKR